MFDTRVADHRSVFLTSARSAEARHKAEDGRLAATCRADHAEYTVERLVRAVMRGVKVRILAKRPHSLRPDKLIEGVGGLRILQDVGARVHTLKHLKVHAKMKATS